MPLDTGAPVETEKPATIFDYYRPKVGTDAYCSPRDQTLILTLVPGL
jgi:hypothetical protein